MVYKLIEVANTHGGDIEYLKKLIASVEDLKAGIKFQAFKYDEVATSDYDWFPVYEELFFTPEQWREIISLAKRSKDVWLDLFDAYSLEILAQNQDFIFGLKLQASALSNLRLVKSLHDFDLSSKILCINVAAKSIDEISEILNEFASINAKEIWLEVGFQAYPTSLTDSGLSKIKVIKEQFGKKVMFADHVDGKSADAEILPLCAIVAGADGIEKHIMLENEETKYDTFSSITPTIIKRLFDKIDAYATLNTGQFLNQKELEYLKKTEFIPFLKIPKKSGEAIDFKQELDFKRSNQKGLTTSELKKLTQSFHLLKGPKKEGEVFNENDFVKAKIGVVVACRMKSSRLKRKALLKIGDLASVEFCLRNALKFENVSKVILATSTTEEDAVLKDFTFSNNVEFFQGHPDDVMDRYIKAANQYEIDTIIRVTADMPFIDNEVAQFLLKKHFLEGAEYTTANDAAVGTNLEIINVEALKRIKSYFPSALYSEYMTWYFQNNPEYNRILKVDLPEELIYPARLTIDYEEDILMANELHEKMNTIESNYSLRDIISFFKTTEGDAIKKLNSHLTLTYKTDQTLIDTLNRVTKIK